MLSFSRDPWVQDNSLYRIHSPIQDLKIPNKLTSSSKNENDNSNKVSSEQDNNVSSAVPFLDPPPPAYSGIQPFIGLAAYFCPLTYLFKDDVAGLYFLARHSFCNFWCRLNVITSDEFCLLHVCQTFESLLLESGAGLGIKVYCHMLRYGLNPVQVALPWLQLGFVGLLEVDQILLLWDRVFGRVLFNHPKCFLFYSCSVGYMDPTLLAILCVAIFLFRGEIILESDDPAEIQALLSEGSRLKVVPLIQMFLFSDSKNLYDYGASAD